MCVSWKLEVAVSTLVGEGRENGVTYPGYCKVCDGIPNNIILSKLETYGFDGWTLWWVRNWLNGHNSMSGWKSVLSGVSWGGLYWDQYCSINLHHQRSLKIDFLSLPAQDVLCLVHPKGWINT